MPELIGEPYVDGGGATYLAVFGRPVLVFEAAKDVITAVHGRALGRGQPTAVFTSDLLATGNDADNRAAVAAVATEELDLVGIAVGPRTAVDKVTKGARMHP